MATLGPIKEQNETDVKGRTTAMAEAQGNTLAHLSALLAITFGLTYGTGFVIVSTFLGSFGVSGGELLRLQYVQVGFYFLLFFGSMTALIVGLSHQLVSRRVQKPGIGTDESYNKIPPMNPLLIVIWIEFLLAIFIPVGFAEPQVTGRGSLPYIALLALACFLVVPTMYRFDSKYRASNPQFGSFATLAYVLLVMVSAWLGWNAVAPLKEKLTEMFWPFFRMEVNCIFVIFAGTLNWLIYRAIFRRPEYTPQQHRGFIALRLAIGVPIYYLCILTFAYGIYPFMSVSKGGGYYKDAGYVRVTFRSRTGREQLATTRDRGNSPAAAKGTRITGVLDMPPESNILPPDFIDQSGQSKALVLIEEDSDEISVADPADPPKPPADHPGPGGVACWTDYLCRPRVFQIQKLSIASLERIPPQAQN